MGAGLGIVLANSGALPGAGDSGGRVRVWNPSRSKAPMRRPFSSTCRRVPRARSTRCSGASGSGQARPQRGREFQHVMGWLAASEDFEASDGLSERAGLGHLGDVMHGAAQVQHGAGDGDGRVDVGAVQDDAAPAALAHAISACSATSAMVAAGACALGWRAAKLRLMAAHAPVCEFRSACLQHVNASSAGAQRKEGRGIAALAGIGRTRHHQQHDLSQ